MNGDADRCCSGRCQLCCHLRANCRYCIPNQITWHDCKSLNPGGGPSETTSHNLWVVGSSPTGVPTAISLTRSGFPSGNRVSISDLSRSPGATHPVQLHWPASAPSHFYWPHSLPPGTGISAFAARTNTKVYWDLTTNIPLSPTSKYPAPATEKPNSERSCSENFL